MKTHLILSEDWQELALEVKEVEDYLKIFGVTITFERKKVDVTSDFLYETTSSWSKLILGTTRSLKAPYIFGLADLKKAQEVDCIGLVCDKSKTLEDSGLYGQQQTLGVKQIIEVYAVKGKKKAYGFSSYTAYCLAHEMLHALADFYKVEDTLHTYLINNKSSLDEYRSELVGKIWKTEFGLLPVVDQKAKQLIDYAQSIGTPIRITEGYRSPERQNELFAKKPKVTNAKAWESIHQYRCAFDIVFIKLGYNANEKQWRDIADYADKLGLDWGGDWKDFMDKPHFELTFGKTLKSFQTNNIDWSRYFVNTPYKPSKTLVFERDLTIGSRGKDVLELQKFLNKNGFLVAKTGAGSIGNETEYFGVLTQKALAKYQMTKGIEPSTGYLGTITRKGINSLLK